jgi:hypothetical protein
MIREREIKVKPYWDASLSLECRVPRKEFDEKYSRTFASSCISTLLAFTSRRF